MKQDDDGRILEASTNNKDGLERETGSTKQVVQNPIIRMETLNKQEEKRLDIVEFYFTFAVSEQVRQVQDFEAAKRAAHAKEPNATGSGDRSAKAANHRDEEPQSPRFRLGEAEYDIVKVWARGRYDVYHMSGPLKGLKSKTFFTDPKMVGCFPSHVAHIDEITDPDIIRVLNGTLANVLISALQYYFNHVKCAANPFITAERGSAPVRLVGALQALIDVCATPDRFEEYLFLRNENPEIFDLLQTLLNAAGPLLNKRLTETE